MKLIVFLQGAALLLQMFLNGFILVMLGPSLPDLQCLFQVDLDTASYLFLFLTLGIISSMSVSGCVVNRYNPYLLLLLLLLTQALGLAALTFSWNIYIASSIALVIGLCTGLQLCLILHVKDCLWPGAQRVTHVLFSVASFGSVMCPLVLNPFLSDGTVTVSYKYRSEIQHEPNRHNVEQGKPSMNETGYLNIFEANGTTPTNISSSTCEDFTTLIQFPYLIMSLIAFPVIIVLMLLYKKTKQDDFSFRFETLQESDDKMKPGKVYLFFMFLFFLQGQGYPSGFSGMLTTYGIHGLGISLRKMTLMTSFFWLMFMLGRMLPSLLPRGFKQNRIIEVTLVGNLIGTALLVGTVFGGEVFLWSSCLFLGLFTGPGLPAGLTWSAEVIYLTPNIKALYLVSASCGIVIPYLCGMLIDVFGENVFAYFFVGFYLENVVVYFIVNIIIKYGNIRV